MNYTALFESGKAYYEEALRNVPQSIINQQFSDIDVNVHGYVVRAICKKPFVLNVSVVETL